MKLTATTSLIAVPWREQGIPALLYVYLKNWLIFLAYFGIRQPFRVFKNDYIM